MSAVLPPDVYRSAVARIVWWAWVVFAAANVLDLAIQGHDHFSAVLAAVLTLITGVTFATALRPRVVADDDGLLIRNPLRDHHVPWGCVEGLELRDSLEVRCRDASGGPRRGKLYVWAVHSPRRGRLKAELRANRKINKAVPASSGYGRLPQEAQAAMTKTHSEHILDSLRSRGDNARAPDAGGGRLVSSWDWLALAAVVIPAVLVAIVALT
ncbi:MAG TPA: PH domain-containing protein [Streptosporangiaceae bacterium]|nr:PH domain-containing protein [Streptosporangiaceae bacterium]